MTGWPLLHTAADRELSPPFSERVNLAATFFKNNLIVLSIFMLAALLLGVLKLHSLFSGHELNKDNANQANN